MCKAEINKTRQYTFTVPVSSARSIRLLTSSTILDNAVVTAIRTRRYSANRKTLGGKNIVNDVNFDAAMLVVKRGSEDVWDMFPVEHIEKASNNSPETGFPVNLEGIDWNVTKLEIAEGVALDNGAVFEFSVEFYLKK